MHSLCRMALGWLSAQSQLVRLPKSFKEHCWSRNSASHQTAAVATGQQHPQGKPLISNNLEQHKQHRPDFVPFELEEWQSRYEMTVKYNLADSGCHPVRLWELVSDMSAVQAMLDLDLHYPAVGEQPLTAFWRHKS